jgi:hypothetical protein
LLLLELYFQDFDLALGLAHLALSSAYLIEQFALALKQAHTFFLLGL